MMVMVAGCVVSMPVIARSSFTLSAVFSSNAPESVAAPCTFLALFTAVLGPPASSALGELASVLLPFAALPVCTLPDTTSAVILSAEVSHNDASPVLHVTLLWGRWIGVPVGRRRLRGELFDEREDVVWFLVRLLHEFVVPLVVKLFLRRRWLGGRIIVWVKHPKLAVDLESRYEVRLLKVRSQIAIL